MIELLPILAQPLAPDCIGLALLFLVVLSLMQGVGPQRARITGNHHAQHHPNGIGYRLHELTSHRHH